MVAQERETDEERLAEEARQITAREYERLATITEFFEYLRETLERVRLQQMQAIRRRHDTEMEPVHERETALVSDERILDRERAELITNSETTLQDLRKKHTDELTETVARHRNHQETYLQQSHQPTKAPNEHGTQSSSSIIPLLLQAQEAELSTLRAQHSRAMQRHEKRASHRLDEYDRRTATERAKTQDEISRLRIAATKKMAADWKWFDAVFLDRALMLGEDERRMVLAGGEAPRR